MQSTIKGAFDEPTNFFLLAGFGAVGDSGWHFQLF